MKSFFRHPIVLVVLVGAAFLCQRGLRGGWFGFAEKAPRGKVEILPSKGITDEAPRGAILEGLVVKVADGDTITVLGPGNVQEKIRLLGIDAPEKAQAFGQKSKARMAQLVAGKNVKVVWKERDQYGRILGTVWADGENVNLRLVKDGLAWQYHYNKDPQYATAQEEAMRARRGLWSDLHAVDPWAFRKLQKNQTKSR